MFVRELFVAGIGLLLLLGGGYAAGYGLWAYRDQAGKVARAETVEATVTHSDYERKSRKATRTSGFSQFLLDEDDEDARRGHSYYPQLTFEFVYDGTTYEGHDLYPGGHDPSFRNVERVRNVVDQYQGRVTAHVDPEAPDEAFLLPEVRTPTWALLAGLGLVPLLAGGALLVLSADTLLAAL